jgi:hypothetical protein
MTTSKRSSTSAKSGKQSSKPDRQKGLAYYSSLLTLAEHDGDKLLANQCRAIIKCLEKRAIDEKAK